MKMIHFQFLEKCILKISISDINVALSEVSTFGTNLGG